MESRSAQLAVMAQDCDQPDYSKLVQALCSEANVSLITVPASKTLGEWCGLCKLDAEGLARKVVGCSFVVIKVRDPGSDRGSAARAALACTARGRRSRAALAPAGLRGGVRGPGRGAGVPEVQVSVPRVVSTHLVALVARHARRPCLTAHANGCSCRCYA